MYLCPIFGGLETLNCFLRCARNTNYQRGTPQNGLTLNNLPVVFTTQVFSYPRTYIQNTVLMFRYIFFLVPRYAVASCCTGIYYISQIVRAL